MPTLEILIGMIASGKSIYARRRANPADGSPGAMIVCHDDLTEMLHGAYRYEPGLRVCYRQMEDWLARTALAHGRDIVIDRTHLTRESRARWLTFARTLDLPTPVAVVAVAFPIESPKVYAGRRFDVDPRGRSYEDWLQVARHHFEQALAEPLGEDEGFDRIERRS